MKSEIFYSKPKLLQKRIVKLREKRARKRKDVERNQSFTSKQRQHIYEKTNGRCHLCGIKLKPGNFQADHVLCHIRGGEHNEDNYLPSCFTCNNYRWHYLPIELQIILKLGVWARTEIDRQTNIGLNIAEKFAVKERNRIKRKTK